MAAVGDLGAAWNDFGPRIAPILSGTRSCTGRAKVNRPLYWKNSPSKVIAPSSRKVRMTCMPSFTRESGLVLVQSMLYCASRPKLPLPSTTSARPSVSSSSVAAACAISVGSRSTTPDTLGPKRTFVVLSAAAANSSHRSLCQVSSAA